MTANISQASRNQATTFFLILILSLTFVTNSLGVDNFIWLKTLNNGSNPDLHNLEWAHSTTDSLPTSGWTEVGMTKLDETLNGKLQQYKSATYFVRIRFQSGTFTTTGIGHLYNDLNNANVEISGNGMGLTTIKLHSNTISKVGARDDYYNYVVIPEGTLQNFDLRDLTIDSNWSALGVRTSHEYNAAQHGGLGYYKTGGLAVLCKQGKIQNVRVTNWGSNSKCTQADACNPSIVCTETYPAGVEAFGIKVMTGNFDDQPDTPVKILNCEVTGFTRVRNGYCTGIIVETLPQQVPTQACGVYPLGNNQRVMGCNNSKRLVLMQGNNVYNITHGIAYGVARAENVDLIGNTASNCKSGFNCDTEPAHRIKLLTNYFYNVKMGINVGSYGHTDQFTDWTINGNWIYLEGRYFNNYLCEPQRNLLPAGTCFYPIQPSGQPNYEPSYCVRLAGGTSVIRVTNNIFSGDYPNGSFSGPSGGRQFYCVWRPSPCVMDPVIASNISGNSAYQTIQYHTGASTVNQLNNIIYFP